MATSRRSFLKNGALGALAAGVSLGATRSILGHGTVFPTDRHLGRVAFEEALNTTFVLRSGAARVNVKLVDVANLGSRKGAGRDREAFSLLFRGDSERPLKQDTYAIEHARLGAFSFLVVPVVSRDKSARYYEVVVNRLYP